MLTKSRCLYEIVDAVRDTNPAELAVVHIEQLPGLKKKLVLNARRVEAHLEAVQPSPIS